MIPAGIRPDAPVEMIDVAPTILEFLGTDRPEAFQGRSLAPALRGEADLDPEHPVQLFRRHYKPRGALPFPRGVQHGVRVGEWKYIERPDEGEPELYNLRTDPGEQRNAIRDAPEVAERLSALIDRDTETPELDLSPEEAERLRALGYIE